jgi:hypothetical protein
MKRVASCTDAIKKLEADAAARKKRKAKPAPVGVDTKITESLEKINKLLKKYGSRTTKLEQ